MIPKNQPVELSRHWWIPPVVLFGDPKKNPMRKKESHSPSWWFQPVSTHLKKNISLNGNLPQGSEVKIQNISNLHPVHYHLFLEDFRFSDSSGPIITPNSSIQKIIT